MRNSDDSEEFVKDSVRNYNIMGCNINMKLHFMDSHLDFFPENLGIFIEKRGERFCLDIYEIERCYKAIEITRWLTTVGARKKMNLRLLTRRKL